LKEPTACKMTLQEQANKQAGSVLRDPYPVINILLAGVILMIMVYSGIFSPVKDNYPVICVHEKLTGQPCASCGLSHSFSLILRGQADEAAEWNPNGPRVFIFFVAQLVLRFAFTVYYLKFPVNRKALIITDSAGSGVMFLIAFWPFLKWMIQVHSS
jgi:hypothetical protein